MPGRQTRTPKITKREAEVLLRLSFGMTNPDISEDLDISIWTTQTHVGNVLRKLGAKNRAHAVAICYRVGFENLIEDRRKYNGKPQEVVA